MAKHEIYCPIHKSRTVVYAEKGDAIVYRSGCLCVEKVEKGSLK